MYLLDTNVVSELRKAKRGLADERVVRWATQTNAKSLFLSVITILELETGVFQMERKDPLQGQVLRLWLEDKVKRAFSGRILAVDEAVASQCARLHVPDRRPDADALIAATAIVHGFRLVTRNVDDFQGIPVPVVNPWDAA